MLVDPKQLDLLKPKRQRAKPPKVVDLGWKSSDGVVRFCLPIKLESSANMREHWSLKHASARAHREAAFIHCRATLSDAPLHINFPMILRIGGDKVVVKITRFGPKLLDDDNCAISAKSVRDGIADALGADDSPKSHVLWEYAQEKSTAYAVGVELWVKRA